MFYHVCNADAMKSICEMGVILPPREVKEMISKGKLDENVLGFSYKNRNASYFPNYVSMAGSIHHLKGMAESICHSKNDGYLDPNFIGFAFEISPEIQNHPEFVSNDKVQKMNPSSITLEALYKGRIDKKYFVSEWPMPVRLGTYIERFNEYVEEKPKRLLSRQKPSVEELVAETIEKFRRIELGSLLK